MALPRYCYTRNEAKWPLGRRITDQMWVHCLSVNERGRRDGTLWEFSIAQYEWEDGKTAVRLLMFDDGWDAFTDKPALFLAFQRARSFGELTLDDVVKILEYEGFEEGI